jgi:tRNA modification GTPase
MSKQSLTEVVQLTPPGRGAVATLRIEGPGAVEAVQKQFRAHSGRALAAFPADQIVVGRFGGEAGEEVVVRRCGDGAVELHCHGGRAAVALIEELLVAEECRRVAWREWNRTRCDDEIAAAALEALAEAKTERTAGILLDQYHGALRREMGAIQEDIDRGDVAAARQRIDALLGRERLGQHLTCPWSVVLAGRPNVGKSSLMNVLAGYGRVIVHPSPGTTRDVVTVETAINGWPVKLCDTAGLREVPERGRDASIPGPERGRPARQNACGRDARAPDLVELAGMERARERMARADLVILVADRSVPWSAEDDVLVEQYPTSLLVHNKCDLPAAPGDRPEGLATSALRGEGVDALLAAISRRLVADPPPRGAAVPFSSGQVEMVRRQRLGGGDEQG